MNLLRIVLGFSAVTKSYRNYSVEEGGVGGRERFLCKHYDIPTISIMLPNLPVI